MALPLPFDLYQLLVNDIAGSTILFIILSGMLIGYLVALFRAPVIITLGLYALYGIIISAFFTQVLALILFIIGVLFAWTLSKIFDAKV